jgi:TonB family protein
VLFHLSRKWRRGLALMLLAAATNTPLLWAQDVTVGAPVWLSPGPAPDELPKPKQSLRPIYSDELRKSTEIGYVIIVRYVDSSGQSRHLNAQGTHLPFQRAVEAVFNDWKMAPAKRGGKPVDAMLWMPVIFNPKLAGGEGPDRSPRLLVVAPVFLPDWPTQTSAPRAMPVRLSLDATGAITHLVLEDPLPDKLRVAATEALKKWRFAPARRGGQPVATEITVPLLFCQAPVAKDSVKQSPPKIISQVEPTYPLVMERFGIRGQVLMEFVVDTEGRALNPIVVSSDNPAFDEPALEALFKWKFQPGTINGKAVNTPCSQTIVFQPVHGGTDVFRIRERADQSKLPPEMRYDVPAKIRGVQIPVYPYPQRRDGTRGKAAATMLIDQEGHVSAVKVRSADRPEFGLALTAALEGFTFDPALKDGKPVLQLINFEQTFSSAELPDDDGDRLLSLEKKQPDKIVRAGTLDAPLKPVSRRPPIYPRSVGDTVSTGEALVECLIDEKGRGHLPRIVEASEPAFGYAAVQAVAAWWFEPPRKDGKPVVTRVQIPFDFKRELPRSTTETQP